MEHALEEVDKMIMYSLIQLKLVHSTQKYNFTRVDFTSRILLRKEEHSYESIKILV